MELWVVGSTWWRRMLDLLFKITIKYKDSSKYLSDVIFFS